MAWVLPFLGFAALHMGLAAIAGIVTREHLDPWYNDLIKSSLTPAGWVFSAVWTTLYFFMAVAITRVRHVRQCVLWGLAQFAVNLSWVYAFFARESIVGGLVMLPVVIAFAAYTAYLYNRADRVAAALYIPYLAWMAFALFLNLRLLQLN